MQSFHGLCNVATQTRVWGKLSAGDQLSEVHFNKKDSQKIDHIKNHTYLTQNTLAGREGQSSAEIDHAVPKIILS